MADNTKILVVDDEPVVVRSCERILKAEGYDIEGALSGREAILKIEENNYNLVLTDLKMPEMDGITLIRWIRKSRPSIGIVVITGYPSQETIKDALDLGIIDYVPKPFTPAVLTDVTRRAFEWIKGKALEKKIEEEFPPSMLNELDRVVNQYKKKPGSSIPVLQRSQEVVGYLPPVIQKRIAKGLNISPAEIHSIVSFYSFFTMKPRGDHTIRICLGTACYVKGIETIINKIKETLGVEVGETTKDRKFSLETVRCLGACGLAPVMVIDHDTYGALSRKKAIDAINQYAPVGINETPAEEIEAVEGE
ncbi:MAG: NAD(P)H-dependent oxidoreductase subunit E [Nitrospirae bacterium]|nr:NAD(P)H-dependent oxidoreductase subunit E [Nitrospirota bacterium]